MSIPSSDSRSGGDRSAILPSEDASWPLSNPRRIRCLMPRTFPRERCQGCKGAVLSGFRGCDRREASGVASGDVVQGNGREIGESSVPMTPQIIRVFCCSDAAEALRLRISARLTVAQKRTAARRPLFPEEIVMKSFSCQRPRAILNANSSISPRVKPMSSSS